MSVFENVGRSGFIYYKDDEGEHAQVLSGVGTSSLTTGAQVNLNSDFKNNHAIIKQEIGKLVAKG